MIKIPEKYYVGIRDLHPNQAGDLPLAFATPWAADSAFAKRKATVDNWIPSRSYDQVTKQYTTHDGRSEIFENTAISGFRISRSVKRTSSWNGGNVVWRVEDPRGFELEIQSGNFAQIVDCCSITNGEIQGNCLWGREGANNILLPEASEPYQEAVKFTTLAKKGVSKKSLAVGQKVRMKDDRIAYYLGDYFGVAVKYLKGSGGYSSWHSKEIDASAKWTPLMMNKRCAFLDETGIAAFDATGDFTECVSSLFSYADVKNVAEILDGSIVVDQKLVIEEVTRNVKGSGIIFPDRAIIAGLSAFKQVEFKLVDGAVDNGTWLMRNPNGEVKFVFGQNFHVEKNYYNHRPDPNRNLYAQLIDFDVNKLVCGQAYNATGRIPTVDAAKPLPSDFFANWTPVTLVAVADGISVPVTDMYYGRTPGIPLTQPHIEDKTNEI